MKSKLKRINSVIRMSGGRNALQRSARIKTKCKVSAKNHRHFCLKLQTGLLNVYLKIICHKLKIRKTIILKKTEIHEFVKKSRRRRGRWSVKRMMRLQQINRMILHISNILALFLTLNPKFCDLSPHCSLTSRNRNFEFALRNLCVSYAKTKDPGFHFILLWLISSLLIDTASFSKNPPPPVIHLLHLEGRSPCPRPNSRHLSAVGRNFSGVFARANCLTISGSRKGRPMKGPPLSLVCSAESKSATRRCTVDLEPSEFIALPEDRSMVPGQGRIRAKGKCDARTVNQR